MFRLQHATPGPSDVVCIAKYVNRIEQYGVQLTRLLAFGVVAMGLRPVPAIGSARPHMAFGLADGRGIDGSLGEQRALAEPLLPAELGGDGRRAEAGFHRNAQGRGAGRRAFYRLRTNCR